MSILNPNFNRLENNYLFAEIAARIEAHRQSHPDSEVISLGIGDVTRPLQPSVVEAIRVAAAEMRRADSFRGYGPYEGYPFLREAIRDDYATRGVRLSAEDIFIGDGAKNELGAILELFASGITALLTDPVYPAYLDANILMGNSVRFVAATQENKFLPAPPSESAALVYLCSPGNPTGAVYTRAGLRQWVDYANRTGAVLLFDAAYERFIADPALPRSIFEIDGAEGCAIEFASLSKTAGFTGLRCGYTVIPAALRRGGQSLGTLWKRRLAVKYNGAPYVVQRAAETVFTPSGRRETSEAIKSYRETAAKIAAALDGLGASYTGGRNAPYFWLRCPGDLGSWEFFDRMLERNVVVTPGVGFGSQGAGYCRLSAFGDGDAAVRAMEQLSVLWTSL